MTRPRLTAFCMDWHIKKSDAFLDMLVEPLKPYADIRLRAWSGDKLPASALKESTVIFCMLPPTEKFLQEYKGKVVWLPMWDQAQGYDQAWWNRMPKSMHVIAFSEQIAQRSSAAKLPFMKLKYFKNPNDYPPARWDKGRTIFYWNRTGLVGPDFLKAFCSSVNAEKIIFLGDIDPRIEINKNYRLPNKLRDTVVVNVKHTDRQSYLAAVNEANIFIAPRAAEGVGMTFLEAMAKGSAVVAYDAPTMNEYIENRNNGILLRNQPLGFFDKIFNRQKPDRPSGELFYLSSRQDWTAMSHINFEKLGNQARRDHHAGYAKWLASLGDYAKFLLKA